MGLETVLHIPKFLLSRAFKSVLWYLIGIASSVTPCRSPIDRPANHLDRISLLHLKPTPILRGRVFARVSISMMTCIASLFPCIQDALLLSSDWLADPLQIAASTFKR